LTGKDAYSAEYLEIEKRKVVEELKENEKAFNEIWYDIQS
jgi:hypothetical protein